MRRAFVVVATLGALSVVPSLARKSGHPSGAMSRAAPMRGVSRAAAELHPASGSQVTGTVTFIQRENQVTVVADVRGLPPNSAHGFHIHEKGDCSAPDATSAGGHFNPDHHPHAGPNTPMRHAGDLGNLEANAAGRAYKRMTVDNITLDHGSHGVLDRAVIVHEKMDDYTTQPTGNSGARIACGVIMAEQAPPRK